MKSFLLLLLIFKIFSVSGIAFSQPYTQMWSATYNGPSNQMDEPACMVVGPDGYIYVAGTSTTNPMSGAADFVTIKYSPGGTVIWTASYSGIINPTLSFDFARAITVDSLGNVYVTGYSWGDSSYSDILTLKYSSIGILQWIRRLNGTGNWYDEGRCIVTDRTGIYVTGTSYDGNTPNMRSIRYTLSGVELWDWGVIINGFGSVPMKSKLDKFSNLYVLGTGWSQDQYHNYVLIKISQFGDSRWVKAYNGPANRNDDASDMAIDKKGNVYITGSSTGSGTDLDYATVKYDSSGNQLWIRRYNGPVNGIDIATAITVDTSGNSYVTGYSVGLNTYYDYATIKYNANGDSLWVRRYDSGPSGKGDDMATSISWDKQSSGIYVTGMSSGPGNSGTDYTTIHYSDSGAQLWLARYNGSGNGNDSACSIIVQDPWNIIVTGSSTGISSDKDIVTIKYSQPVGINPIGNSVPEKFSLQQNYPNPFNPITNINYDIPFADYISIKVFDILGNEVETLVNEWQSAGSYSVTFDASNKSTGIYFYKLLTSDITETKKMMVVK